MPPGVDADAYRSVMQLWPSGVAVVTMAARGGHHGMTASAFTSVSINPPLVLVVVDKRWRSHDWLKAAGAFCVNVLGEDQRALSDRFAGRGPDANDKFHGLVTKRSAGGGMVLEDAAAYVDCLVDAAHDAGDHTIFVGRVVAAAVSRPGVEPLIYHRRRYRRLAPDTT